MRYGSRKALAPAIALGTTQPQKLDRQSLLRALLFVIRGTWKVTGGNGSGTIHADSIWRLIKSLTISVAGEPVQTWTGQTLRVLSRIFADEQHTQTPPTSLAAGASQAIEGVYEVPFYMPASWREDDFSFPSFAAPNPNLTIEYAVPGDLAYGHDPAAVLDIQSPTIEMWEVPIVGAPMDSSLYAALRTRQVRLDVTQSGPDVRVELPNLGAGWEIRALIIEAMTHGEAGTDHRYSDTLVENVAWFVDGRAEVEKTPWRLMQQRNRRDHKLPALEPGVVVLDSATDRDTGPYRMYGPLSQSDPYLTLDLRRTSGDGEAFVRVTALVTDRLAR